MASFLSYLIIFVEPLLWIIRVMLRVQILLIKWLLAFWFQQVILTHYSPVLIIDTPWKYQKTFRLYWVNVFKSSRFIESLELQWSETDLVSGNRINLFSLSSFLSANMDKNRTCMFLSEREQFYKHRIFVVLRPCMDIVKLICYYQIKQSNTGEIITLSRCQISATLRGNYFLSY